MAGPVIIMLNNYICAVDIGSSRISAAVVRIKKKRVADIFFETAVCKGIKRGVIIDAVGVIEAISSLLKKLKAISGINIKAIYTNVSGDSITTKHSFAALPLAERGNRVITRSDINRVNEQARILGSSIEEEIIHQIPFGYSIDSKKNILNPLELYSHKLDVDLYLVCAKSSAVENINRAINQSGYEMKDLFLSGLATSRAVFGNELKPGVHCLCDIGADITELVIFRGGVLQGIRIMNLGGDDLTQELSGTLKLSFELAEEVKKSAVLSADYNLINEDKEILIRNNEVYNPIKQRLVSEALTKKVQSFCQTIKEDIERQIPVNQMSSFVVCGRAALLEGFLEIMEGVFGLPVRLARINNPEFSDVVNANDALISQKNLLYVTALGIIACVIDGGNKYTNAITRTSENGSLLFRSFNKVKEIYREYF